MHETRHSPAPASTIKTASSVATRSLIPLGASTAIAASAAMYGALRWGGGAPQRAPEGLTDPGLVTGWGLQFTNLFTQASLVIVIGFIVLAVFLMPTTSNDVQGLAARAVHIASRWTWVWMASALAELVFATSDAFALPIIDLNWNLFVSFAVDSPTGQALLVQAFAAVVIGTALRWTISARAITVVFGLAIASLVPTAYTGHSAGSGSHDLASVSLLLHLVGVCIWVGGLGGLTWLAMRGSKRLVPSVARFSGLALSCIVLVGVSGIVNAAVRLGEPSALVGTRYGQLVIVKVAAIVAVGYLGWLQRRRLLAVGSSFVRIAVSEVLVMAAAVGVAVALSRTPTPVSSDSLRRPIEELLGGPLPPAPNLQNLFLGWSANGTGLAIVALGATLYAVGAVKLQRRGVRWPVGRTLSWYTGLLVLAWATIGGLGEYSNVMFSMHMVAHMLISMVAPIFLVMGAPITLALRALPGPRQKGDVSPRTLLTSLLHSRLMRLVAHPLVAASVFVASFYVLYFSGLFEVLMRSTWGHAVMQLHFLAVGCLFYYVIIGIDPSPRPLEPIARLGLLLVTLPFHAFFAISVMSSNTVFAASYYQELERPYATDLLRDQYAGGSVAWILGEIPLALCIVALVVQWVRSDNRIAKRLDRKAERDNDADLSAYNAYLLDVAQKGRRRDW